MLNAKKELLEAIKDTSKIKCASISTGDEWNEDEKKIVLKLNYSQIDYEQFLKELDFEYDNGFGGQELFGTVWLEDNTWLSRGEYDGSEWWEHNVLPSIPEECQSNGA